MLIFFFQQTLEQHIPNFLALHLRKSCVILFFEWDSDSSYFKENYGSSRCHLVLILQDVLDRLDSNELFYSLISVKDQEICHHTTINLTQMSSKVALQSVS